VSFPALFTLLVLVLTFTLLVRQTAAPGLIVLGADVALLVAGVLTPEGALGGFSNPAPFTVAALFVVAAAVEKTGILRPLVARLLSGGRKGGEGLGRLLVAVAGSSAFLNNTPIVAMLSPEVSRWAEERDRAPSRYLMPVSFASILGGTLTVIGTSTTIVVSGLLVSHGYAPLGIFEITPIGLPLALGGILLLWVLAPRILPDRRTALREFEEEVRKFTVVLEVERGGPLEGRILGETELVDLKGIYVVRLDRESELVAPVVPSTVLRGGDRLTVRCPRSRLPELERTPGVRAAAREHAYDLVDSDHAYFEAVVGPASPLNGHTLKEVGFRMRYGGVVVGLHRPGEGMAPAPSRTPLRTGDTLFVLAGADFGQRWKNRPDFLLIHRTEGGGTTSVRAGVIAGGVVVGVVGVAAGGLLSILEAALLGALGLLGARVLTPREAARAVDPDVVLLIASAFGLGRALEVTGLAELAGHGIVELVGGLGATAALLGIVAATLVLTELITNNAAAVLVFPIAMGVAADVGLDPRSAALAVAVAASASFLTPIGYQTNTMVYGPGGYRFTDYFRLGVPLTIFVLVLVPLLLAG